MADRVMQIAGQKHREGRFADTAFLIADRDVMRFVLHIDFSVMSDPSASKDGDAVIATGAGRSMNSTIPPVAANELIACRVSDSLHGVIARNDSIASRTSHACKETMIRSSFDVCSSVCRRVPRTALVQTELCS